MEAVELRFPGSGTSIDTATVKLAGKPRLSDSVVVEGSTDILLP